MKVPGNKFKLLLAWLKIQLQNLLFQDLTEPNTEGILEEKKHVNERSATGQEALAGFQTGDLLRV